MGSIGIISLTTRRNRRFFISAEHYPVVKVRPTCVDLRRSMRKSIVAQRSAGRWPAGGRQNTDQGLDDGPASADPLRGDSGGPEIFGWRPRRRKGWWRRGDSNS
jgi:hypothetical protein